MELPKPEQDNVRIGVLRGIGEPARAEGPPGGDDRWLRLVVENSLDLISLINQDNTIRYISPSVRRLLGYSPEELEGTLVSELVHPEDFLRFGREIVEQI